MQIVPVVPGLTARGSHPSIVSPTTFGIVGDQKLDVAEVGYHDPHCLLRLERLEEEDDEPVRQGRGWPWLGSAY